MKTERLRYLDDKDKRILSMISKGFTYKEIANEIYLSIPGIKARLSVMRMHFRCKTTSQLIAHLTEENLY